MNTDRSAEGEELYAEKNSGERCVLDIYTYKNCIDFWIVRKIFYFSIIYSHYTCLYNYYFMELCQNFNYLHIFGFLYKKMLNVIIYVKFDYM